MDFLSKILRYIKRDKKNDFRVQVREEKRQKYLFRDVPTDKYQSRRKTFFREQKRKLAPFTDFFQSRMTLIEEVRKDTKILGIIGSILLILCSYIVFFSPYFKISPNNVLIDTESQWIDMNIAYRAMEETYGKSIFFLDETETAFLLKKYLKNISRITIDKLYPNGIKVIITGAPITYITNLYGLQKQWDMTDNGVLIPGSKTASWGLQKMEIISESLRAELFLDYKQVIPDQKMLIINAIINLFRSEFWDLTIGKVRFFEREDEIHIALESGTKIILTLQSPNGVTDYASRMLSLKEQLFTLKQYIINHLKQFTDGSTIYVDARIPKKIFICREENTCKQNLRQVYGPSYE